MLTKDNDLSYKDIQALDSPDALAAFFAHLGYDTNHRLVQHTAAIGITGDNLTSSIQHIERLASQDGGLLEVYLFQLRSLTVANTQNIVRNFRNRSGDYLFVMTDDYNRLDFVLLERYSPATNALHDTTATQNPLTPIFSAPRQVGVRPRILTVQRLKPNTVSLRVLRRFTYTESDIFAQYDKLLSAYDVADWSEPFFNNRALFSDYYLKENLPASPYWDNPNESSALMHSFRNLRTLYDGVRDTFSNAPERDVQHNLIEPVLTSLGFTFQPAQHQHNATEITLDYRLYATTNTNNTDNTGTTGNPLALCLAYAWGRSLDGKDEQRGDAFRADENPGAVEGTIGEDG